MFFPFGTAAGPVIEVNIFMEKFHDPVRVMVVPGGIPAVSQGFNLFSCQLYDNSSAASAMSRAMGMFWGHRCSAAP